MDLEKNFQFYLFFASKFQSLQSFFGKNFKNVMDLEKNFKFCLFFASLSNPLLKGSPFINVALYREKILWAYMHC